MTPTPEAPNAQKSRTGLHRLWHATRYSFDGLRAGWGQAAFRQEALAALVLLPLSLWLGDGWVEVALLGGVVLLVLVASFSTAASKRPLTASGPSGICCPNRPKTWAAPPFY